MTSDERPPLDRIEGIEGATERGNDDVGGAPISAGGTVREPPRIQSENVPPSTERYRPRNVPECGCWQPRTRAPGDQRSPDSLGPRDRHERMRGQSYTF